jgi:16S rRNA C1402 (ribose-2'-O) methylase RsmI
MLNGITSTDTIERRQGVTVIRMDEHLKNMRAFVAREQRFLIDQFWRNPLGLTPEQVAAGMPKPDVVFLFAVSKQITDALIASYTKEGKTTAEIASLVAMPTNAFHFDADGTFHMDPGPYVP